MMEISLAGNPAAYLDNLGKYSKLALTEQSSKAGAIAKKSIRNEYRKATTEWSKEYRDGNLVAFKKKSKLGVRLSHRSQTIDNPANMENFIQTMTHVSTGTTVIMGAFKSHRPLKIENGKITGYLAKQSTITRRTIAILEKLNSGEKSSTYMKSFPKGSVKGQFRGNQPYKERRWSETGFNKAYAEVKTEMTDRLLGLIANYELQQGETA